MVVRVKFWIMIRPVRFLVRRWMSKQWNIWMIMVTFITVKLSNRPDFVMAIRLLPRDLRL